jgi:type IV secretion system protein VirD4
MAGYGIRAYLIAQSLNQISKAYGENNAILDNCHVRIAFSSNDERTAKRISDALGTATEIRAQRNYAGHRLSPWLGHVMVSRQETARPLLTPGEVMQLPSADELVLLSGQPPIRAKKLKYYEDRNFIERVISAPELSDGEYVDRPAARRDDWSGTVRGVDRRLAPGNETVADEAGAGGLRREPDLFDEEAIARVATDATPKFDDQAAAVDASLNRLRNLGSIVRAHAINEGAPHRQSDADLVPEF